MTTWGVLHAYRHLADEGKVKPLSCPDCNGPVASRTRGVQEDPEPWLWCPACDTWTKPGIELFDRILAVVKEHNV